MMRPSSKPTGMSPVAGAGEQLPGNWELRPGGMLVQKRDPDSDRTPTAPPPPTVRVRVKYGSLYHEINISSQATFGELKKMLTGPTGLHHQDQKLMFKDKERDSNVYLDVAGVKDRSKIVLLEDPISREKRFLEMRRTAKIEKAAKSISQISLEVDRLAGQVSALDLVISKGGKVAESTVLNLIETLMNQLLKLDGIMADGDAKLQRKMQVRRVQKYVEALDILKIKNSSPIANGSPQPKNMNVTSHPKANGTSHPKVGLNGVQSPIQNQQRSSNGQIPKPIQRQPSIVTTNWETFDSAPPLIPLSPSSSTTTTTVHSTNPWEFFE